MTISATSQGVYRSGFFRQERVDPPLSPVNKPIACRYACRYHRRCMEQGRFTFSEQEFATYHADNPHIYVKLREYALEAKRAGRKRLSINLLFERLRWYTTVETQGDEFKLNNNWRAYYARLLMTQEPQLAGMFETRRSKADEDIAA